MAGLVTKQHHRHLVVLDLAGLLFLDTGEPFVGQIEGDADDRHPVGATPRVGQVERRAKRQLLRGELPVQPLGERLQRGALDLQPKIANPRVEQFAANGFPTVEQRRSGSGGHVLYFMVAGRGVQQ